MEPLYIIKIGGNIIDDERKLLSFLKAFAAIEGHVILVHGGGKLATRVAEAMGNPQQMWGNALIQAAWIGSRAEHWSRAGVCLGSGREP